MLWFLCARVPAACPQAACRIRKYTPRPAPRSHRAEGVKLSRQGIVAVRWGSGVVAEHARRLRTTPRPPCAAACGTLVTGAASDLLLEELLRLLGALSIDLLALLEELD